MAINFTNANDSTNLTIKETKIIKEENAKQENIYTFKSKRLSERLKNMQKAKAKHNCHILQKLLKFYWKPQF